MPIDRSKYPDDWGEISLRIREEAGQKCQWCSAPNHTEIGRLKLDKSKWILWSDSLGDEYYKVKVVLTVAHLDHDTTNNDDSNLRALCQLCHLRYDAKEKARKRKGK